MKFIIGTCGKCHESKIPVFKTTLICEECTEIIRFERRTKDIQNVYSEELKLMYSSKALVPIPQIQKIILGKNYLGDIIANIDQEMREYDCEKTLRVYFEFLSVKNAKNLAFCVRIGRSVKKTNMISYVLENKHKNLEEAFRFLAEDVSSVIEELKIIF